MNAARKRDRRLRPNLVQHLRQIGGVLLVYGKDERFAEGAVGFFLCVLEKRFAHHPVAVRREYLAFQVLNLETLLLFVDGHHPPFFLQRVYP